jgi:16S rRNA (cytidine1402-2'-O)-methyltransferase
LGTLYLVATPIGNLEDVTLRALRVLREAGTVAAEDTRTARKLLAHYDISPARLVSYNEHNMASRTQELLTALESGDVALVSEAGTPGISDPGYELILAALGAGHEVSPVPGASAPLAALMASGLPFREFTFIGFFPRKSVERRRLFRAVSTSPRTVVGFESPHRLRAALEDAVAVLGERRVAICREMTKLHEEVFRGTIAGALAHFEEPRGEFTVVLEGSTEDKGTLSDEDIQARLEVLLQTGESRRDASAKVSAETGVARRRVYALALQSHTGSNQAPRRKTRRRDGQ